MTGTDLFSALNDVEERFILEAAGTPGYIFRRRWIKRIVSVAALMVVITCIGVGFGNIHQKKEPFFSQYRVLSFDGNTYYEMAEISLREFGERLGRCVMSYDGIAWTYGDSAHEEGDDSSGNRRNVVSAEIYSVGAVSPDFAVGVGFAENQQRYVYLNREFSADSFRQFDMATQFRKYAIVNRAVCFEKDGSTVWLNNITVDEVYKGFFSEDDIPLVKPEETQMGEKVAEITFEYTLLGDKDASLNVYDGGYATIEIGQTKWTFRIGTESVGRFVNQARSCKED